MCKRLIVQLQRYKELAKTKRKTKCFFTKMLIFVEISHLNDIVYPEMTTYNTKRQPFNCYLPFSKSMAIVHLLLYKPTCSTKVRLQPHSLVNIFCFPCVPIFDLSLSVLFAYFLLADMLLLCYLLSHNIYIKHYI